MFLASVPRKQPTLTTHCHLMAVHLEPTWPPARTKLATSREDPVATDTGRGLLTC